MNRKRRIERVKEEIRALKAQRADLAIGADLLPRVAQLDLEIEAKERELDRLNGR